MTKKYLIDESEKWAAQHLTGRPMKAKEVEVLEGTKLYDAIPDFDFRIVKDLSNYLKVNNLLIVKIIE